MGRSKSCPNQGSPVLGHEALFQVRPPLAGPIGQPNDHAFKFLGLPATFSSSGTAQWPPPPIIGQSSL